MVVCSWDELDHLLVANFQGYRDDQGKVLYICIQDFGRKKQIDDIFSVHMRNCKQT
jgi:hypothetical protein